MNDHPMWAKCDCSTRRRRIAAYRHASASFFPVNDLRFPNRETLYRFGMSRFLPSFGCVPSRRFRWIRVIEDELRRPADRLQIEMDCKNSGLDCVKHVKPSSSRISVHVAVGGLGDLIEYPTRSTSFRKNASANSSRTSGFRPTWRRSKNNTPSPTCEAGLVTNTSAVMASTIARSA